MHHLSCGSIEREIGPLILETKLLFRNPAVENSLRDVLKPRPPLRACNVSRIGGCIHFVVRSHDRWNALSLVYDRVVETVHDCSRRDTVKKLNRYAGGTVTAVWCELLRDERWTAALEETGADPWNNFFSHSWKRGRERETTVMMLRARKTLVGRIFKWNATLAWSVNGGKSLYVRWAELGGGQYEPSATGN